MASFDDQNAGSAWSSDPFQISAETHSIETPEQVALQFNVAGIGSRFAAILLDSLLQFAILLVVIVIAAIFFGTIASGLDKLTSSSKWFIAILILVPFLLYWGYFGLFEAFWHGQTPGKRVMKLRVIKDSGRQITLFEALARNLLRYVDYMPGFYLIGLITMMCNKLHKRLGDFAAGTIVIHERLSEEPMTSHAGAVLLPSSSDAAFPSAAFPADPWRRTIPSLFPADAVAKLSPQDLLVIETFFGRALDLTPEMRASIAGRIARQMAAKMGVPLPEGNPERALESIAYMMRGSSRSF